MSSDSSNTPFSDRMIDSCLVNGRYEVLKNMITDRNVYRFERCGLAQRVIKAIEKDDAEDCDLMISQNRENAALKTECLKVCAEHWKGSNEIQTPQ